MITDELFNFLLNTTKNKEVKDNILLLNNNFNDRFLFFKNLKKNRLKADTKNFNNFESFEIKLYLNSIYYRITELFESLSYLIKNKNYLSSMIILRHLHETLCQLFYVIDNSKKYFEINDYENFYKLTRLLTNTRQQVSKPIHVNEFLRYFKKNFTKNKEMDWGILSDESYDIASKISHPSSEGSLNFYSTFYKNNYRFLFSENQKHSEANITSYLISIFVSFIGLSFEIEEFIDSYEANFKRMFNANLNEGLKDKLSKWDDEILI